jgi:AhpC/TSA family
MTLEAKLAAIRDAARTRIPPETRATMEAAVEAQRRSGVTERIARVGQPAPDFTLPDAAGTPVRLKDLLATGPVVLSFYRGRW